MAEIVDLKKEQKKVTGPKTVTTTKEDEVKTTEHGDKNNTTIQQTLYGYQNPDGTIDPERYAQFQAEDAKGAKEMADRFEIDPTTGRYKGTPGALLGFDPEEYKKEQEAKQRLARFKQKEAGWRNALGVITDIATTAAGGNVWVRQPDNVAKQEQAKIDESNLNINKMGTALAQAKAGREAAWLKAEKERHDKLLKANQYQVTQSHSTQGQDQTTTSGGGSKTNTSAVTETTQGKYQQALKGNSVTINGQQLTSIPVRYKTQDGKPVVFDAEPAHALAYARGSIAACSRWLIEHADEKDTKQYKRTYDAIEGALHNAGIKDPLDFDPSKNKVTDEQLLTFLQQGKIFNIDDFDIDFEKLYKDATGKNITTVPVETDEGFDPDGKKEEEPAGGM